jgi:phosphoribosyl-ATP pyrophosphohydrolase/phosphoribosyl-AMP cyclohydrolase/histidinol dehydrogenase
LLRRVRAQDISSSPAARIPDEVTAGARQIVESVQAEGDTALRRCAEQFDGLAAGAPLIHDRETLNRALHSLPPAQKDLLERVAERIRRFALAQRASLTDLSLPIPGGTAGHEVSPLAAAGCYAPGGRHPLPSSVLMTAVTARAAGVPTVVVACPDPAPIVLAAAAVAGADLLLACGGAQAVAAMAYGTETLPACDVVVGPGNVWVTAAKLMVESAVRTDGAAGPSELVVVADGSCNPRIVAADLLAQAEHDPLARPILITLQNGVAEAVDEELTHQLPTLPTAETARQALAGGCVVQVGSPEEAVTICNRLAPEHLQWNATGGNPPAGLRFYGGLFLGEGAAEVLGDYGAGPNHVLPTGGAGRRRGGLWVGDFLAIRTWLRLDRPAEAQELLRDTENLARLEGLEGHARAAAMRLDR